MNSKEELCPEPLMSPTETVSWTWQEPTVQQEGGGGGEGMVTWDSNLEEGPPVSEALP